MNDQYIFAKFWRCALQVNPFNYEKTYRGVKKEQSEEEYNDSILQQCKKFDIKVVGIANHGNVDSIENIQNLLTKNDIVVFPGFEIASNDKIHYVCLFPEETTKQKLERFLGALHLLDPKDGIRPSKLSSEQLIEEVDKLGGFIYAAHCTQEHGLLKNRLNHIWKSPRLRAAQIPGSLNDLPSSEEGRFYKSVLSNKNPEYKRERKLALINAKDVAKPEDLEIPNASCLVKMTRPTFQAFRIAFLDPESRIRLNSETTKTSIGKISQVSITGGYLNGLTACFSDHLNTVIGGRGSGKSTLLECIRYALDIQPKGEQAQKIHNEIIKENLGKESGQVNLTIISSSQNEKKYTISRKYKENPIVRDAYGNLSELRPFDLLPNIEIYGQNEIFELTHNENSQLSLLNRFLPNLEKFKDEQTSILHRLKINQQNLTSALYKLENLHEEVKCLPKLQEELLNLEQIGIKEKLSKSSLLAKERLLVETAENYIQSLSELTSNFRSKIQQSTNNIETNKNEGLPDQTCINDIQTTINNLTQDILNFLSETERSLQNACSLFKTQKASWESAIQTHKIALQDSINSLPSFFGKSGREVGVKYDHLVNQIEEIKPKKEKIDHLEEEIKKLEQDRKNLLTNLQNIRNERISSLQKAAKLLNRKMNQKIKVEVLPNSDRSPLVQFLVDCDLEGIKHKRLSWINEAKEITPASLAETIRQGMDALIQRWDINSSVADALSKLSRSQLLALESLELGHRVEIYLNVAHEDNPPEFRPLNKLSTGQQCTAILHILLTESVDPLLMDQPEDNLDNAFIAERIVAELRAAKTARQFLFATHNANIPVFGDAEWIGVFSSSKDQGILASDHQGSIDVPAIRDHVAFILEGGREAFIQRKEKYEF